MTNHYPTCSGYGQCDCDERQQMRAFPVSELPQVPAGRLEQVEAWLNNVDEDGNPDPLITREMAAKLLAPDGIHTPGHK